MAAAPAAAFFVCGVGLNGSLSFFDAPEPVSLVRLIEATGCTLRGNSNTDLKVKNVGPVEAAGDGSLTFVNNSKYLPALSDTQAAAVICAPKHADQVPDRIATLVSDQPYKAFAIAAGLMFPSGLRPQPVTGETGISTGAFVHPEAQIEAGVIIEHGAVIGAGAMIGEGTLVGPNAVVGAKVRIGRNCSISAGSSVIHALVGDGVIIHSGVRIGGDGFGFAMGPGGHIKIPQVGRVIIQDNVEIGSNTTIDRGANRDTVVGAGTKIDNLVMIGHNVVIGCHCVIVGQVGIAGSSELGDYVVLGGKAAINGHVKIGDGAQIAGLSGVSEDVPPGVQYGGVPARPVKYWMRDVARIRREVRQAEKAAGERKS